MYTFILLAPNPMYGMSPDNKQFLLGRIGMDRLPKMYGIIQEKVALEVSWFFFSRISILCDSFSLIKKLVFYTAMPFCCQSLIFQDFASFSLSVVFNFLSKMKRPILIDLVVKFSQDSISICACMCVCCQVLPGSVLVFVQHPISTCLAPGQRRVKAKFDVGLGFN